MSAPRKEDMSATDKLAHAIATAGRQLAAWQTFIDALAAHAIATPHGQGTRKAGSPVETEAERADAIAAIARHLDELADEVRLTRADPRPASPGLYLAAHASWIARYPGGDDIRAEIESLRDRAARLTGNAPEPTEWACPVCMLRDGHAPRMVRAEAADGHGFSDTLECPACGWKADGIEALEAVWRLRLYDTAARLDPKAAARMTGANYSTVRDWIRRGLLDKDSEGRVSLAQTRRLAREAAARKENANG